MVKQKINASDVMVLINEFKAELLNARLNNVYDINNRCFLFKLTKENKDKKFVLLDSNPQSPRFQITKQSFERRTIPSSFCSKLRKHLTNKKITMIRQLGSDRILDLQFGFDNKFHIIMELYDSGNLILTDNNYKILTLVRRYTLNNDDEENILTIKVGNTYPTNQVCLNLNEISAELLKKNIEKCFSDNKKNSLRNVFISATSPIVNLGKDIIYHSIHSLGWNPSKKIRKDLALTFQTNDFLSNLRESFEKLQNAKGYIIYADEDRENKDDIVPILYSHVKDKPYIEFDSMSLALDEYFKSNVSIESKQKIKETTVQEKNNKLDRLKNNLDIRVSEFQNSRIEKEEIAEYLMSNIDKFDFLDNFNPNNFENDNIISINKKNSELIFKPSDFDKNIVLKYNQNIWNNIKLFHSKKKEIRIKIRKTKEGGQKAINKMKKENKRKIKANKSINEELKIKIDNIEIRDFWFQKFKWFFTTEGNLVLLGKDAHQNELLVKKHFTKNDIYLHSDTHGSGSCIIKNIINNEDEVPSHISIEQASSYIICNSKAWKHNSPDKAFWVYHNQVSKTPPTGEYLPTGSFMIRGKKNYIITSLQLGFGIMFKKEGDNIEQNIISTNIKDDIEWAIPVLGPYSAIRDYKFKVKIVPGKIKKGKGYNYIIDSFLRKKDINLLEKYLIRRIKDGADTLISGIYINH
jgi:predicted ribosome quality control (RQC) complex YloA/Tae2 family protein